MKQDNTKNIVLLGNPNAGKSSVFNQLTGLQQKVGNFAGVTIDRKIGQCNTEDFSLKIIDLPGTYSLYPSSIDESIVLDILLEPNNKDYPDLIVYVLDINQIERHTLLLTQLIDLQFNIIVAVNMLDIAQANGININLETLEHEFKLKFVAINGRTGKNIHSLKDIINEQLKTQQQHSTFYALNNTEKSIVDAFQYNTSNDYQKLLLLHHSEKLKCLTSDEKTIISELKSKFSFKSIELQLDEIMERYEKFVPKIQKSIAFSSIKKNNFLDKIDQVLAHKTLGIIFFFILMLIVFQAIFSWSAIPMDFIDNQFANLSNFLSEQLPNNMFSRLLVEGIIPGISGILIFVPQILILFLIITFLEDIGYMSRVIYLFDHTMQKFGLNGRSIVALISGGACAVPAIMSTRTISNWKERIITILVTPFISCSARIPVFALLIAIVIPQKQIFGFFNLQGIVFMSLYLLGIIAALGSSFILSKIIKTKEISYLILELPSYKTPHWKNIGMEVWNKVKAFIFGAGKIILFISIILWFLASYGPNLKEKEREAIQYTKMHQMNNADADLYISANKLENSYAGIIGKAIEPIIKPLGFDWKIGIALITSFAAREVFIGTISTLYSIGKDAESTTIQEKLKTEKNQNTQQPVFNLPVAFSLIIFYVFAMQCMSTLAVVYKETKSWKYPLLQFTYMSILAYISSFIVYQLFK